MLRSLLAMLALAWMTLAAAAQDVQTILRSFQSDVANPSRRTVDAVLDALLAADLPAVPGFLQAWQERGVYVRAEDGLFFFGEETAEGLTLRDIDTGAVVATGLPRSAAAPVRPNGGVRAAIAEALVVFQLSDPDLARRSAAVEALARNLDPDLADALAASMERETDPALRARKAQLLAYTEARFGTGAARLAAIEALSRDLGVEGRAVLSQILATRLVVARTLPEGANIARVLKPGSDALPRAQAYALLVEQHGAPAAVPAPAIRAALERHVTGGTVGGVPVARLSDLSVRDQAYDALAAAGVEPPRVTETMIDDWLARFTFADVHVEPDPAVTDAAAAAQAALSARLALNQTADLGLDALSLASIYFLAAIGLAITFGVMGVINMAHGEFIMMGAYTGYVVQLFIPDYTLSLIVALPLAFAVTFGAGVAMERLVIRWLYDRPLETLLATFGISIALQQLAKNIFGTQARPLTAPGWLDGTLVFNEVVQISYIRVAIFVLALMFLGLLLFILKRTRLGLEIRAVTQNPRMAASMGINPDRIKMMTFGLGSGIAGIAGVAIGLYAKVTSEMGADYIVQSFMTVVVGGVGNVWGTLLGATMIGGLQKGIEWFNPSNTLAAQTYMILFIILFIQVRPKGIIALKGRAAGD